MATDDLTSRSHEPRDATPAPCHFTVRLWKEELTAGSEYRGSVRDVKSDAFRAFNNWSDLVAFMVARIEHEISVPPRERGAR